MDEVIAALLDNWVMFARQSMGGAKVAQFESFRLESC
jgi:hypothetical protein